MSENYVTNDGYRPLLLPTRGEEFEEGRQYVLTPLARLILNEVYGLAGIPTVVECVRRKSPAMRLATHSLNLETGEAKWTIMENPARPATLRAYVGGARGWVVFTVDVEKMDELAPFYDKSHKLPALERAWNDRNLPATHRKFRGCSLRWWSKGALTGAAARTGGFARARATKEIDLSDLD